MSEQMTREHILAMEPSRELDALVAEKVFGLQVRWERDDITDPYPVDERDIIVDIFSAETAAAWEVVNELMLDGYDVQFYCVSMGKNKLFDCIIFEEEKTVDKAIMQSSIELAICKAALLAVMVHE